MKYTKDIKTDAQKIGHCARLKAELITEHNLQSDDAGRAEVLSKIRVLDLEINALKDRYSDVVEEREAYEAENRDAA
jgi:hypothetical protein